MINFFHKKVNPVNPTNFVKGFLHESADSLVQVFHKSNHHILAKFYEYALYDRSAETIPAMVALLDFEMQPTTEKRDFIMRNFVPETADFGVNVEGKIRKRVVENVALEEMTKANFRRVRRGAFIKQEVRPFMLSQMPTTFENTGLAGGIFASMSDTWIRYSGNVDLPNPSGMDSILASYRRLACDMTQAGFNASRYTQPLPSPSCPPRNKTMSWAAEEFKTLALGDARLNKRAVLLAERLAAKPTASIPNACSNWTETIAAYRFLGNDALSWQDVMQPHWHATVQRVAQHPLVLCLQDTTELDYNGQQMQGLGPLSYEAQRGMYLHPTYVVTPEREPLGVTNAWMWARQPRQTDGQRPGMLESLRWIESYERVAEQAAQLPQTRHVCISDREGDIMALLERAHALDYPADYLVRCKHNRVLPEGGKLWQAVMDSQPLGCVRFEIPAGRGRKARSVKQEVRVQRIVVKDSAQGAIEVSCLIATEIDPPAAVEPVVWRLLTNCHASTLEQACELIDWYRARWEIELFFLVLKEGCKVQQLQLGDSDKVQTALALYMVIAWRINRLMRLGRTLPELPADLLFEPDEWKAAFILNKKRPPKEAPQLNTVLRLIAQRGGFLARKGDGEPGAKTIWLGLQDVATFVAGMRYMREAGVG